MWENRKKAEEILNKQLTEEKEIIYEGFNIIKEMLCLFENHAEDDTVLRIVGLILLKGKNLCKAMFSLNLDGLAQESGAILRPTIESIELIKYVRLDNERVDEILKDDLPTAGKIAEKINGSYKNLRSHLNENASHLSFSFDSMRHLVDLKSGEFVYEQKASCKVLKRNLIKLFAVMFHLIYESFLVLDEVVQVSEELALKIEKWRIHGLEIAKR